MNAPPKALIAAAEMTPSGVPPIPHSRLTGERSETDSSEALTSPSVMRRTRAPASRMAWMPSSWRGRSRTTTMMSRMSQARRSATRPNVWPSGRSSESRSATSLPAAIFSM